MTAAGAFVSDFFSMHITLGTLFGHKLIRGLYVNSDPYRVGKVKCMLGKSHARLLMQVSIGCIMVLIVAETNSETCLSHAASPMKSIRCTVRLLKVTVRSDLS